MVHIPTTNMVMTGGWFMALSYPHYEYDRLVMSNIAIENETFIVDLPNLKMVVSQSYISLFARGHTYCKICLLYIIVISMTL